MAKNGGKLRDAAVSHLATATRHSKKQIATVSAHRARRNDANALAIKDLQCWNGIC